jgi:hypothetical protein
MKKIYAGSELAVVVLDSPGEIERVQRGLLLAGRPSERRRRRAAGAA